jgi:outer membrane protein OmpA-like peptidoglycan-associated protein
MQMSHWTDPGAALALLAVFALSLSACATAETAWSDRTTRDAIIGTATGAAVGAAVDENKRGRGAAIGAVVGGLAGGLIGNYLERQAEEIDAIPDADVRGDGDRLLVAFPGDVMFDVGSQALSPGALSRMDYLADTLRRYPETDILVKGHTDATGDEAFNLRLSEDRASAVKDYLVARGVAEYRIDAIGLGEAMPLATNRTAEGRVLNRRVEFEIRANDELRERDGSGGSSAGDPYRTGP